MEIKGIGVLISYPAPDTGYSDKIISDTFKTARDSLQLELSKEEINTLNLQGRISLFAVNPDDFQVITGAGLKNISGYLVKCMFGIDENSKIKVNFHVKMTVLRDHPIVGDIYACALYA